MTLPETIANKPVPGEKQGKAFMPTFVIAWAGMTAVLGACYAAAIPSVLKQWNEATAEINLAAVLLWGGVIVVIVTPLSGWLSDRTMSRMGMRRPWIIIGVVIGSVGIAVLAVAGSLVVLIIGWVITQAGYGITSAAVHALLADQIETRVRGRVSAAVGIAGAVAVIVAIALVTAMANSDVSVPLWFIVPGVIAAVMSLSLVFGLKDIVRDSTPAPATARDFLAIYWLNPLKYRDFGWAFIGRVLVTMSLLSVQAYWLYYINSKYEPNLDAAREKQVMVITAYALVQLVTAAFFGWLSDKSGRRKRIIWVSCILTAMGLLWGMQAPTFESYLLAMLIIGAGQGAYVTVDVALMTEVLPDFENAGKDLGIVSLSYLLPQVLVPVLAGFIFGATQEGATQNYPLLYGIAIVLAVLGGLSVIPIRSVK